MKERAETRDDSQFVAITARILLVPYAIALALIVWLPAAEASKVTGIAFRIARFVSERSSISLSTSYTVFEFLANIALFVPLGLLLVAARPRSSAWVVLLLGYSASVTSELVQTLLPNRYILPTSKRAKAEPSGKVESVRGRGRGSAGNARY